MTQLSRFTIESYQKSRVADSSLSQTQLTFIPLACIGVGLVQEVCACVHISESPDS